MSYKKIVANFIIEFVIDYKITNELNLTCPNPPNWQVRQVKLGPKLCF